MCSIAMPTELILGHSPPVYNPLLYRPLVTPTITTRSVPPRIRPCLSTGSLPLDSLKNNNDSSNKQKKRVVFADDRGRPLTQVRVMSEPSNVPPLWTTAYIEGVTGGLLRSKIDNEVTQDTTPPWQVTFPQPASDYLAFRRKLDQENVSLENVIVRESEQALVGTVKVRNLAYDKEVVVRASTDIWKTHEDNYCTYVEQPGAPALILYDTFRFRLTLPLKSDIIEFCVRYRTDGQEFWDNNEGKNYVVRKRQEPRAPPKRYDLLAAACDGLSTNNNICNMSNGGNNGLSIPRISDARRINVRTWSEFASWHHLTNDAPYW
ncbi:protein phosphatase 1 regulatory subunit 3C-B [Vespula squamosa]|uniref:Protein phosphatase 1 regulatory subunit 3C-B n=1 Tax=Vespula squamosa TaxID=30214 RepID=A0ABD1ZVX6_VESSQ